MTSTLDGSGVSAKNWCTYEHPRPHLHHLRRRFFFLRRRRHVCVREVLKKKKALLCVTSEVCVVRYLRYWYCVIGTTFQSLAYIKPWKALIESGSRPIHESEVHRSRTANLLETRMLSYRRCRCLHRHYRVQDHTLDNRKRHLLVHYISSSLFETLRFWYPPHFGSVDVYEHSQLVVIILVVIFVSLCVSGKQRLTTQILSK